MIESYIKLLGESYLNNLGYICIILTTLGLIYHKNSIDMGIDNIFINCLPIICCIILLIPLYF